MRTIHDKGIYAGDYNYSQGIPCEVCGKILSRSEMGLKSHYRTHVRSKLLTEERATELLRANRMQR